MRAKAYTLSAADHQRLCVARGAEAVDPHRSLFGPQSIVWQVNREAVLLLGGGRALLLQVAHPLVAAGVVDHSHFRHDPLTRLRRTLELMLTITFADAASAIRAVRDIERVHARVHGVLKSDIGPFPRGTPYDANDPQLLFWVHATLVDTALMVYERYVTPLSARQRTRYYEESKISARLMGIPEQLVPPRLADFLKYMSDMIRSPVLAVGPASLEIAAAVLRPPLPSIMQPAFWLSAAVTTDLLPPALRRRYGLAAKRPQRAVAVSLERITRTLLPFLPNVVRLMPHARRAAG